MQQFQIEQEIRDKGQDDFGQAIVRGLARERRIA